MINYIIPIGSDCRIAQSLDRLNLRKTSLPFDYIYSDIEMIGDCLDNNFENFLKKDNYIKYKKLGCINKFYKKKYPHFNMLNDKIIETMQRRINRFENLFKSENLKLFVHISGMYKEKHILKINDFLKNRTTNYMLLVLMVKRQNYDQCILKYKKNNVYGFDILTTKKDLSDNTLNKIFSNFNFNLIDI